jgi:regulator of protease activity HflC (stomatin/prohibitin superfamily)
MTPSAIPRAAISVAVIFILAMMVFTSSVSVVKTGNVALLINHYTGHIDSNVRHAGLVIVPPFSGTEILEIPTYERTYTMVKDSEEGSHTGDDSILVNTQSSNSLNVDTSITYHIAFDRSHPERLVALYKKYRNQFVDFATFEETQLRPSFRQSVVDAFGIAPTAEDMTGAGKRAAAAYALNELNQKFAPDSIVVDEVRIRTIYPDQATIEALRSRLQAQQNLKLAQLNQQLQALVNQKSILAAQAESQAAHVRAASLTPRLVKFRHLKNIEIIGVPRGAIISVPPDQAGD